MMYRYDSFSYSFRSLPLRIIFPHLIDARHLGARSPRCWCRLLLFLAQLSAFWRGTPCQRSTITFCTSL